MGTEHGTIGYPSETHSQLQISQNFSDALNLFQSFSIVSKICTVRNDWTIKICVMIECDSLDEFKMSLDEISNITIVLWLWTNFEGRNHLAMKYSKVELP